MSAVARLRVLVIEMGKTIEALETERASYGQRELVLRGQLRDAIDGYAQLQRERDELQQMNDELRQLQGAGRAAAKSDAEVFSSPGRRVKRGGSL